MKSIVVPVSTMPSVLLGPAVDSELVEMRFVSPESSSSMRISAVVASPPL